MKLKIEEVFSGYIFVVFRIFSQKKVGRFQKKIGFPIKADYGRRVFYAQCLRQRL